MHSNFTALKSLVLTLVMLVTIAGCDQLVGPEIVDIVNGPDEGETQKAIATSDGNLRVLITDDPFPIEDVSAAMITIERIELRNAKGGTIIVFEGDDENPAEINLVELQDGVTEELSEVVIPPGEYRQARIIVGENSTLIYNDTEYALKVPSGTETGIKVNLGNLLIEDTDLTALIFDIPLDESFVVQGNPNSPAGIKGFIFKPVVHLKSADQEKHKEYDEISGTAVVEAGVGEGEIVLEFGDQEVVVNLATDLDGMSWNDLVDLIGQPVEVEVKYVETDGKLVAKVVKFESEGEDDDEDDGDDEEEKEEVEVEGEISEIGDEYIVVGDKEIYRDEETEYVGVDNFEGLEAGDYVKVEYVIDGDKNIALKIEVEEESQHGLEEWEGVVTVHALAEGDYSFELLYEVAESEPVRFLVNDDTEVEGGSLVDGEKLQVELQYVMVNEDRIAKKVEIKEKITG